MPWEAGVTDRAFPLALALSLVVTAPVGVANLTIDETIEITADASGNEADEESNLIDPLFQLAPSSEEAYTIHEGHTAGQAWATATLADAPSLEQATNRLYDELALEAPATIEHVPDPLEAPLASLITLQAHHAANAGPYAGMTDEGAQAFTLGALEPVLEAFGEARHDAPEEPVFVDPLGLIILGGSGDHTYEPHDVGPTTWKGAMLLVEPAGNDTYDVPVAAPTEISSSQFPPIDIHPISLALELGGNDAYNDRTAGTERWMPAILVDRGGNDTYAATDIEGTTAHASPGFAYLLDEEGNDTYHAHSQGIAHAVAGGTAILWDQHGNDTYKAHSDDARFTHAMGEGREARTLLWDEQGEDRYAAELRAFGVSWDDAVARFVDEAGDDAYSVFIPNASFGFHLETAAPFITDSLLDQGLGEFIDAGGADNYEWDMLGAGKDHVPDNDDRFVDHRDERKHGVFIDCETPAEADRPCEEDQHEARCTMLGDPRDVRDEVEPVVQMLLDPIEDECRQYGPAP